MKKLVLGLIAALAAATATPAFAHYPYCTCAMEDGKVEWTRRVSDRSALELVTESMRPLHTGDFAGLWLKLVYFVFGLLLTMMVFSGMMIWLKRTAQATAKLARDIRAERALPSTGGAREAAE